MNADVGEVHVAVTGAAGYIGSRVVTLLTQEYPGATVTALDNFYRGDLREVGDVPVQHVDIRDRRGLEEALSGADVVLHLAAVSGVDDCDDHPDLAYEVNVQGTNNVAWWCRREGAGLVFPFSMAVLGDPDSFPITVEQSRDPLNWYGRTKLLGERAIDAMAPGAFPAHQFMISNLFGSHEVDGRTVSKGTVINYFLDLARRGEPLTVYEPGTQARNYVHVDDVARAYLRSVERIRESLAAGRTGVEKFAIASDEDHAVERVATLVRDAARELRDVDPAVTYVENPRADAETLTETFTVDTTRATRDLGWEARRSVESVVRESLTEE